MEVQLWQRRLAIAVLAASLILMVFTVGAALTGPADQSVWARFRQTAIGAIVIFGISLGLLPTGHRARSWLWVGVVGAVGFTLVAMIEAFAQGS